MIVKRGLRTASSITAVVGALLLVFVGRGANPVTLLPRILSSSTAGSKVIYVDFISVVNLPLGARVLSRGTQIGTLESIELVPNAARLKLNIDRDAHVPTGSTADLRQSTLLGDIYVALTPPQRVSGTYLSSGDLIPLADTDPGPQIEDIITNLASFMSGGSIMRVQDALRRVNSSVDVKNVNLRSLSRTGAKTITDLADNTSELSSMINTLQETSASIASDPQALAYTFGPAGHRGFIAVFDSVTEGFKLVAGSAKLAAGLLWLYPRLIELNPFLKDMVPLLRSYSPRSTQFNGNMGKAIDVAMTKVIPFTKNGDVALVKMTLNGHDSDATRSVAAVLRMIGALR